MLDIYITICILENRMIPVYICIIVLYVHCTFPMILLYSEDEPEETLPASRVISSQIIGYDGGEVYSKERVEVIFPIHVSLCIMPANI